MVWILINSIWFSMMLLNETFPINYIHDDWSSSQKKFNPSGKLDSLHWWNPKYLNPHKSHSCMQNACQKHLLRKCGRKTLLPKTPNYHLQKMVCSGLKLTQLVKSKRIQPGKWRFVRLLSSLNGWLQQLFGVGSACKRFCFNGIFSRIFIVFIQDCNGGHFVSVCRIKVYNWT